MLDTRTRLRQVSASYFFLAAFAVATLLSAATSYAQNRVDLDDLSIKGELLNDNRMRLSARDQHKLVDRVLYRDNFRREITDGLETNWPEPETRTPASTDGGAR